MVEWECKGDTMERADVLLGEIIRTRRKEKRMTQTDLANRVGSTTQCIYYYEKGRRGMSISLFFKICSVLDLSPDEIQRQIG